MKQLIKHNTRLWLVITIAALFTGCEKGPNIKIVQYPAQTASGMSPVSGYAGTYVTISGKNFGVLIGAVKVFFGGVTVDSVISCADNQIVVKVPAGAITGKVTLQVWTHTNDSIATYTVIPTPVITSVTSEGPLGSGIAAKGDTVIIKGTGFGTDLSKIAVSFNGTSATIISPLTDTSISVITPTGYASGSVIVTVNGYAITGAPLLNPDVKGDITVFYLKNYQQPFTSTAASGTGRWRDPTDWIVTSPILNHTYGGWDSDDGTVLAVESGWGAPSIVNGKMYQTVTLPVGNYTFSVVMGNNGFVGPVYIDAAAGATLPDATLVTTNSLGYLQMVSTNTWQGQTSTSSFNFTLTQQTQVSLGFVVSMSGNEYMRVTAVKLVSY